MNPENLANRDIPVSKKIWKLDFVGVPVSVKPVIDGTLLATRGLTILIDRVDTPIARSMTVFIPADDEQTALRLAHQFITKSKFTIQSESPIVEVQLTQAARERLLEVLSERVSQAQA